MTCHQVIWKITRTTRATVLFEALVETGCWIVKAELANINEHIWLPRLQEHVIRCRIKLFQFRSKILVCQLWDKEPFLSDVLKDLLINLIKDLA
jgi:hypothetical protein